MLLCGVPVFETQEWITELSFLDKMYCITLNQPKCRSLKQFSVFWCLVFVRVLLLTVLAGWVLLQATRPIICILSSRFAVFECASRLSSSCPIICPLVTAPLSSTDKCSCADAKCARKQCTALRAGAAALWRVSARARFCERAGARPVAHACSERPHAPPTARMREGIKSLSPSPPFPLDPFLSGRVGGGSAARSRYAAAGVAALDPCPRSWPTPTASAKSTGGDGDDPGDHHPFSDC